MESGTRGDTTVGHFRLPADRRSTSRPGSLSTGLGVSVGPEEAIQNLLEAVVAGDIESLTFLLLGPARETLSLLLATRNREALSFSMRRNARTLLDCRMERQLEIPGGDIECRLRLFRLEPGGQVRSCLWVVQTRLDEGGSWRISGLDRLPGAEEDAVDSSTSLPP